MTSLHTRALIIFAGLLQLPVNASATEVIPLASLLQIAYERSPQLKSTQYRVRAAKARITTAATPQDPVIGVNTLERGNKTRYGTIQQKIRFPVKYYVQAKANSSDANSQEAYYEKDRWSLKRTVTQLYYSIYSAQRILELTHANMEAVKEFARVAERKYAAGRAVRADSRKAHFEITRLELDLIRQEQEEKALQDKLRAVLNDLRFPSLRFDNKELPIPKINKLPSQKDDELRSTVTSSSPNVLMDYHRLQSAEWRSALAKWEFAPDIQFQYQKRLSGAPVDSRIYSIGITVPLFFWGKSSSASAANAEKIASEFHYENTKQNTIAEVKNLRGKVEVAAKTLKIYRTSLIPQAEGAYNSSRAAYRANKSSFINLLDSERSLYQVRTDYYRSLQNFVANISTLEEKLGQSISNLGEK